MGKTPKREARMLRESVLWHAAAKHGSKVGDREVLESGSRYAVDATVSGVVVGDAVCVRLCGTLLVNHDQLRANSTGPKVEKLLAAALGKLSSAARRKFVDELAVEDLDQVDARVEADCRLLMQRLRTTETQTARGAVRFEPSATPPPAESARAA